jgi:hypothetical protein
MPLVEAMIASAKGVDPRDKREVTFRVAQG